MEGSISDQSSADFRAKCEASDFRILQRTRQRSERLERHRFGRPLMRIGNMCRRDRSIAATIGRGAPVRGDCGMVVREV